MFDDFANRQIGDFVIQDRMGQGAMSVVYRAVQQSVNRRVSLKVINLNLNPLAQENYQPYFIQEASVIATLEHIHIVPVYNYGTIDGESSYIAMRMLLGGSVQELLGSGPLNLERAVDIFSQAAQGLAYAHSRGIIHRDLKPTNILLDDLGNAYLTDFGLGKLAEVSLDMTVSGTVIGTALYASPEQLTGEDIDQRTDIYSMSAILYHMLAGRPPFEMGQGGLAGLIRQHATETPPPLRHFDTSIPEDIDQLVLQGLSRVPAQRPVSIEAMADALNASMGRRISRSSAPAVYLSPPLARRPRRGLVIAAVMLTVIVALVAVALLLPPSRGRPQVLTGEQGTMEQTVPTTAEIDAARQALGENGFIAFIACTLDNDFQAARARMMEIRAGELGLPFRAYDSQLDRYQQITLVERARLEGAKALVLCTLDTTSLTSTLESAQEAGLPLIFTTPQQQYFGGIVLDPDNRALGVVAGTIAGQIIQEEWDGEARVVILESGFSASDARVEGMLQRLAQIAPNAQVIERLEAPLPADSEAAISALIEAETPFNLILSVSDTAAFGALAALEQAAIPPDAVAIISINGEEQARQYVREGRYFRATVSIDLEATSRAAIDAAARLLAGATLPETIAYPPGDVFTAAEATPEPASGALETPIV